MDSTNWNLFKAKNNNKESKVFENMCYLLFCAELDNRIGLFRYKNQTGIETEPLEKDGELYGFQSKYYDNSIGENKSDIIDSINKAKRENDRLKYFYLYVNKELSESSKKRKKKPEYQKEIEAVASNNGLKLIWRVPSEIELQLSLPENRYIYDLFFETIKTEADLIDEIKNHNELILQDIENYINFNGINIKIDRKGIIEEIYSKLNDKKNIIISGEGGCGKTAILKELYTSYLNNTPVCIFKASELNVDNINRIFNFGIDFTSTQFSNCFKDEEKKYFVIDSAEKLAELQNTDVLKNLLNFLRKDGWTLLFTVRHSYISDLEFQLKENFNLSYEIKDIENLSIEELRNTLTAKSINLPKNENLIELIRNLFYLKYYIKYYKSMNSVSDLNSFYEILWQNKIQNALITKEDIHIQRQNIFLEITRLRCETGRFYIQSTDFPPNIIAALKQDEIIEYDRNHNGVFITHDIYEEWGLNRIISIAYANRTEVSDFFKQIGTSLPVRRAFRLWLQNGLLDSSSSIISFIHEIFQNQNVEQYWKDELLIAVMLSNYADTFFSYFENDLIDNNFNLLKRAIFLLRIACTEIADLFDYEIYKPKGNGWKCIISLIYKHQEDFFENNFTAVLPILKYWTSNIKEGCVTKECGLLTLFLLNKAENEDDFYLHDKKKDIFDITSNSANEIKEELTNIFENVINNGSNKGIYHKFAKEIIINSIYYTEIFKAIPNIVLKLCDFFWTIKKTNEESYFRHSINMETRYGINDDCSYDYHTASPYITPIYWLLHISFIETLDFIISFTNKCIEKYKTSDYGDDVEEVILYVNEKPIKQYLSWAIWSMFRGTGSPVVPDVLQSIHMALEKALFDFTKNTEVDVLKNILYAMLIKSKSASITAIACSIVLARPNDFYEIALCLFKTIQFFSIDSTRCFREHETKFLYGMIGFGGGVEEFYAKERLATCEEKFRNNSLENLFLQYQLYGVKGFSEEQNKKFLQQLYEIIDFHKDNLINISSPDIDNYKILVSRFDRRNLNAKIVSQKDEKVIVEFISKQMDEKLKKISENANNNASEMTKYFPLSQWADFLDSDRKKSEYKTLYNDNPLDALKEVKVLIDEINKGFRNYAFMDYATPAYVCSKLIIEYFSILSEADREYCKKIILNSVNQVFSKNYSYQIHDGVEAATHAIPYLIINYPDDKLEYAKKIVLLLLNTTSIGEYKRICDYAIEAILSAKLWDADYSITKLILYTYAQIRIKIYNLISSLRDVCGYYPMINENKIQEIVTEKLSNMSVDNETDVTQLDFDNLDFEDYEIILKLIPVKTEDIMLLNLHKRIINKICSQIFQQENLQRDQHRNYYRLRLNIFRTYSHFILNRKVAEISDFLRPMINNLSLTEETSEFIRTLINVQWEINKKHEFWIVWNDIYPKIKSISKYGKNHYLEEIIINYLLAWKWWGEDQKEWNGLSFENKDFYEKCSRELNNIPATLYSISRILNNIGSCFFNEGIYWLYNIISAEKIDILGNLESNTLFYLEKYMRKFIYENKQLIKMDSRLKNIVIEILNWMIELASVHAYLLRESIL